MEKSDEKTPVNNNGFFLDWWYFAGVHHSLSWNTFKNNLKKIYVTRQSFLLQDSNIIQ